MTTDTLTLADFLLARIAEDEALARGVADYARTRYPADEAERYLASASLEPDDAWATVGVARVLAECEANRRIVTAWQRAVAEEWAPGSPMVGYKSAAHEAVHAIAAVYADHPDYRDEWRP